ncbi:MAG: NYN domain-containing protein [Planctomycetota bacterium]
MDQWIIDGNNLIHRDPRLRAILQRSGFEAARRFLEAELGRRRGGRPHFHVIYDEGGGSRSAQVTVHIARRGTTADEEILRVARERGGRERLRVVTSDRKDIGSRLAGLSAEWVSAEEFRRILWGDPRRSGGQRETAPDGGSEKPGPPRGREVDHWLQEFEADRDEASPGGEAAEEGSG